MIVDFWLVVDSNRFDGMVGFYMYWSGNVAGVGGKKKKILMVDIYADGGHRIDTDNDGQIGLRIGSE